MTLTPLKKDDLVRVLCTARSVQKEELEPAIAFMKKMGFRVDLGDTVGKVYHQSGGTAQERLADFQKAWNDPEVAAIWIARGGYGTIQILEGLDFTTLSGLRSVKPIMGYSDVTLIHCKMQKAGLPSMHVFMPLEITTRSAFAKASFVKTLFGKSVEIQINNSLHIEPALISGKLYGGNLSILYSLLGSQDLPDFTNGILLIEEIDEYLYHIERMMYALKRAGKLRGLKALLVGGMTDMNDHDVPFGKNVEQIILDITKTYHYPVILNIPAGHVENNICFKMGVEMNIKITPDKILLNQE